jgi:hypothetical protein
MSSRVAARRSVEADVVSDSLVDDPASTRE